MLTFLLIENKRRLLLEAEVKKSFSEAWALGTNKNYVCQGRLYVAFCLAYGYRLTPPSVRVLCAFVQFLSREFKAPGAIKNYLTGPKWLYVLLGFSTRAFEHERLKLLLRAITRSLQHLPRQALPLTDNILLRIGKLLDLSVPNDAVFWALLVLAFNLMARKSNLTPVSRVSFDPSQQLVRRDVVRGSDFIVVSIRWSKTNQFRNRILTVPILSIPGSLLCPVAAYDRVIELSPGRDWDPLFVWQQRGEWVPITYREYLCKLRSLLQAVGLQANAYSTHSLRRGGATAAGAAGLPRSLIANVGDWRSDIVDDYIFDPFQSRVKAAKLMKQRVK